MSLWPRPFLLLCIPTDPIPRSAFLLCCILFCAGHGQRRRPARAEQKPRAQAPQVSQRLQGEVSAYLSAGWTGARGRMGAKYVRARRSPGGLSGRSRRSLGFRSLDVSPLLLDLGRGRADLSIRSRKRENYMRRFSLATPIVSKNVPRAPGVVSRFSRHAQAPNEVIKPEVFQTSPLSISPPPLSPPYKLLKGLSTPTIYQSLLLPSLFGANLMAEVTEPH